MSKSELDLVHALVVKGIMGNFKLFALLPDCLLIYCWLCWNDKQFWLSFTLHSDLKQELVLTGLHAALGKV